MLARCQDVDLSYAGLDHRLVRHAGQAQRDDGGLGRHRLDPPCLAVSLGKATYTYGNLVQRKAFTVNVPFQGQVKEADYFGLASGRETDKFAPPAFTPVRSDLVYAPYVRECPLVLECKVLHVFELGLHTQFVGQILDVKADEEVLDAAGMPDILKVLPIIFSPGNRVYYGIGTSLAHAFMVGKEL